MEIFKNDAIAIIEVNKKKKTCRIKMVEIGEDGELFIHFISNISAIRQQDQSLN